MRQLVRIAYGVDRRNAAVADIERRHRVGCAILIEHKKTRQSIDSNAMNRLGRRQVSLLRQAFEEADDLVPVMYLIERGLPLAAVVAIEDCVLCENLGEFGGVAGYDGAMKRVRHPRRLVLRNAKPRPRLTHVSPAARSQLPTGAFAALEHLGDVAELHLEHVMQEEGRALERREPLERHQERERKI